MTREQRISTLVSKEFEPVYLAIENESNQHHVPKGAETHFKVVVVSGKFATLTRLERQRWVNRLLREEFTTGLHALSLHTYSPEEWETTEPPGNSPKCLGGYLHG